MTIIHLRHQSSKHLFSGLLESAIGENGQRSLFVNSCWLLSAGIMQIEVKKTQENKCKFTVP